MTDAPQGRVQKFFAVVLPRLKEAGYDGYGSQARLIDATGMSPGTVSRLVRGKTIPDIQFFPALAKVVGMSPLELLVLAGHFPEEALQSQETLSETNQSQVGSKGITPEEAADRLGFHDEVRRSIFFGMIDTLRNAKPDNQNDGTTSGDAAAQM
ncbi:helix-turn-helix domain-containing protein [Streptomyces acidicola]|uniref:helix-turn-helix domain-containing protein n=1 Tax=Streptomyces acidicola TaxID=2596892 RepID=UPI003790A0F7